MPPTRSLSLASGFVVGGAGRVLGEVRGAAEAAEEAGIRVVVPGREGVTARSGAALVPPNRLRHRLGC